MYILDALYYFGFVTMSSINTNEKHTSYIWLDSVSFKSVMNTPIFQVKQSLARLLFIYPIFIYIWEKNISEIQENISKEIKLLI